LRLYNFRNYSEQTLDFTKKIVCLSGANGSGKTNVLEAIYYLCFTKAYRSSLDKHNMRHGCTEMAIEGWFAENRIKCIIKQGVKKEIFINDKAYQKFSAHIGKFPAVIITPDDIHIINGYSPDRRKYFDLIISQTNAEYLQALIEYKKSLQQRNSFLKSSKGVLKDNDLLEIYNDSLVQNGSILFEGRKKFIQEYLPQLKKHFEQISGHSEEINLEYQSQLSEQSFKDSLNENLQKDLILQRTSVGPHKDEYDFSLKEMSLKQSASQGQRKTFLFALKLAEYDYLLSKLDRSAILLLDDVFEKLDANRSQRLIDCILSKDTQVFITDTHKERLKQGLASAKGDTQLIEL